MQIEMLYFHSVRKRTGRAGEKFSLRDGANLGELRAELLKRYPALEGLSKSLMFAVRSAMTKTKPIGADSADAITAVIHAA